MLANSRANPGVNLFLLYKKYSVWTFLYNVHACTDILPYSWLFSRYLNSANASFSFTNSQPEKLMLSSQIYSLGQFFEGSNFTNLSNPQNLWNLNTLGKTSYTVFYSYGTNYNIKLHVMFLRHTVIGFIDIWTSALDSRL